MASDSLLIGRWVQTGMTRHGEPETMTVSKRSAREHLIVVSWLGDNGTRDTLRMSGAITVIGGMSFINLST